MNGFPWIKSVRWWLTDDFLHSARDNFVQASKMPAFWGLQYDKWYQFNLSDGHDEFSTKLAHSSFCPFWWRRDRKVHFFFFMQHYIFVKYTLIHIIYEHVHIFTKILVQFQHRQMKSTMVYFFCISSAKVFLLHFVSILSANHLRGRYSKYMMTKSLQKSEHKQLLNTKMIEACVAHMDHSSPLFFHSPLNKQV